MTTLTFSDIIEDLQAAEKGLHKFERRYWMSSEHFYELYSQGLLDNGAYSEDFAEWAGHCKLRIKRTNALEKLSRQRIEHLEGVTGDDFINVAPQEPVLELAR